MAGYPSQELYHFRIKMQGYRYPDPMLNNGGSGTGISPTLKDFLLPIYKGDDAGKVNYQKNHFLQTARTLCDLGFFTKYRHLSDDALMLEIICLSIDCDGYPEALFLEGNYREMLEVDTERILCCPSLHEWEEILEDDLDLEDNLYMLSDLLFDDELLDEDCEKMPEDDALPDEDYEEMLEEGTLLDKNCNKRPEYSFDTLLHSLGKLSKISRGKFVPENVVEVDNNCIQFDLEGQLHSLTLNELPYEPSLLAVQINPIISETGYQFELFSGYDNRWHDRCQIYVIFLSEKEKEKLAHDTNGIFDDFWMFPRCYVSLELLYGDGCPLYTFKLVLDILGILSRVSRGKFIFQNIVEIEKELIELNLNGRLCTLVIKYCTDDPLLLAGQINPIIADTGYQYEFCTNDYNDGFLVLLSEDEKQKLMDKKGWNFQNCWEHYKSF